MVRDEFNNVEVTNDKQLLRVEFGKTQSAEFTSKKENEAPEDELNKKVVGKTIKKVTEVNVDYVNKVQTHGTQTVVTSSATASTAGTVAATTAVAASTVAVVAIATVTGISVGMHDYKYDIKSFIVSSNELRYELVVYDALVSEEDYWLSFEEREQDLTYEDENGEVSSAPFKLRVYNQNYDASQYVWGYSTCSGSFDHLTLGDTYNIVLTENRYGGEEIFKDTFTTYVNTSITSFDIYQETDAELGTFDYYLDYVDDEDSLLNILLEFYQPEIPEETIVSYELEKYSGFKTIRTNGELDLNSEWGYRVSYTRGNDPVVYKESTIAFRDYRGRKAEYRGFTLNREANFKNNSIDVTIDYDDGFGWYQDFSLIMTLIPTENDSGAGGNQDDYYSQEIPLQPTSETQTIVLDEYEMYVYDSYFKYTYRLTCNYRGNLMTLEEETTPFSFTDMSGATSEFYGLDFKKEANFLNNTFKIRLDYVDDLRQFYGFTLHLFPSGVNAQYDFYLTDTNEEQTCEFDENQHWNFSFDYTYSYTVTYYDVQEEVTYQGNEDFVFTDISGGVSEFKGYTFDGTYDISTGMAEVQLDYQDDFNYLDNFVLHLLGPIRTTDGPDGPNPFRADGNTGIGIEDYPYAISLEKTTEVQYFNVREHQLEIEDGLKYISALTYEYRGEEQDPVENAAQIEFNDPDALSEFRGITFVNGEANFVERSFYVQLDFQDDYGYYSNFTLQVRDTTNNGWVEKQLDYTTEPQKVTIDEYDDENYIYPVDIVSGTLTYNLYYVSSESGDPAAQYLYQTEPSLSFTNSLKSEFYGLDCYYDLTTVSNGSYEEYRLPFRMDLVNDAECFSTPELYVAEVGNEETPIASFQFANEAAHSDWTYGSFSGDDSFTIQDLTNGDEYLLVLKMWYSDEYSGISEQRIVYSEAHSFTLDQTRAIRGVRMQNYCVAGSWELYFDVIANGDYNSFTDGVLTLEAADGSTYTYNISIDEYVTVQLYNAEEGTLDDNQLEDIMGNPVSISLTYTCAGVNDPITLQCLSNYQFYVSH